MRGILKYSAITAVMVFLFAVSGCELLEDRGNPYDPESDNYRGDIITIAAIPGVVVPVTGATPVTTAIDTVQYTGTITWSPADNPFAVSTVYTANIVLTAKAKWTLTGVATNFFTVAGATSITNTADSGVVTAMFPATVPPPGTNLSFTLPSSIGFNMKYVPGGTFPTGTDDLGGNQTINTPYWMAETEVTYELWYAVRTWARANGYTLNANPGIEGHDGTSTPGAGAAPTGAKQEPVTTINWREAMVWCNALTEYYNANNGTDTDLDCVYYTDSGYTTPIRSADDTGSVSYPNPGGQDDPYVKSTAKGFRLPGSMEWECAARYNNGTDWTAGTFASGATAAYTDFAASSLVAWFGDSLVSGTGNTTSTQPVKTKNPNALGLYDMSGNVWEFCFDWLPSYVGSTRVVRGASWDSGNAALQVGGVYGSIPYTVHFGVGFRLARSAL